jgi:DMSO/TMAO reductase YedYZ molybdopterin-dependent catalytic subunit
VEEASVEMSSELAGKNSGRWDAAGLTLREMDPLNLESPPHALLTFLTPNSLFYVRNHFSIPKLDTASYELRIDGAVAHPLTIGYEELRSMQSHTRTVMLECAGNSRVFLARQQSGVQWELGAVGNAEWTGVLLDDLLNRAEVMDGAVEVVLEGADLGEPTNSPKPAECISFARSLPIQAARKLGVMLAYQMNGRNLPIEHGFPVRAIVPGYYAMASVKWLTHIRVAREPFQGYWQSTEYAYWDASDGNPVRRPLASMMVKAVIARPVTQELVEANALYRVTGAAWAGESEVTKVEFTADGGESWHVARLSDPIQQYAWRHWEYEWRTPAETGQYTLSARATDAAGSIQPERHDANYGSYAVHHTLPIDVFVGRTAHSSSHNSDNKW